MNPTINTASNKPEAIAAANAPSETTANPAPPPIYYVPSAPKDYFIPNAAGGYVRVRKSTVENLLIAGGFSNKTPQGGISEVDEMLIRIQTEHAVEYVGSLAGYQAGYYPEIQSLIISSPVLVEPVAGTWPILNQLMDNLFGEEQLPYVFGWLKTARTQYRDRTWVSGQAFVLCGPAGAGKNLFRLIVSVMFGGEKRVGHPYQFMTGGTTFNSDMFAGEILAIEDESESRKRDARIKFGSAIKQIVANKDHRHHRKYEEAVHVSPLWRLIVSLNDNPERIAVLPPMDEDIEDKIMLFKVRKHPMPMPTSTAQEQAAFKAALIAELPAFVHFLENWEIPEELKSSRFGVKHYHHPELIWDLDQTTPEFKLLEMIDEALFDTPLYCKDWEGKSEELARLLKQKESPCGFEARKLLEYPGRCGTYLGRLEKKHPTRISFRTVNGHRIWTIRIPAGCTAKHRTVVSPTMYQKLLGFGPNTHPAADASVAAA